MTFLTKLFFEVINLFFNNQLAFAFAKKLELFDAVFVMYPANTQFANYFTFSFRQFFIRWRPYIVGVVVHPSGKRTLMFAISTFIDKQDGSVDVEMLRLLHSRVDAIRASLGAATTHFAGTLPGRLSTNRVKRGDNQRNERVATERNVVGAILHLREKIGHTSHNPVVILGSNGYIGKEVVKRLKGRSVHVIEVDKAIPGNRYKKPCLPHVVVNITSPEAINQYVDPVYMDSTMVLLNEVYPAPHEDVVRQMNEYGVRVFHIAGVIAKATPPFPHAYGGAVPCCAALPDVDYEVKIIEL